MIIEYGDLRGKVTTFDHEYGLMYRIEWTDYTIDVVQKVGGEWKDITMIAPKDLNNIGQLIDPQLKKAS